MKTEKNGTPQHNGFASQNVGCDDERSQVKYLPGIWNQYYATFSVCVAAFGLGASSGWVSPMILVLESADESPVGPLTILEISPLETLPAFAALFGTVIFAGIMTRFGRKTCGYSAVSVTLLGWLLLLSATHKMQLYIGRFITGMCSVGLAMIGPIYLSEISYVEIRGTLMAYTQFANHCGTLVSFLLGTVCNYRLFTAICMIGPILFPFFFFRIPESPQFLLLQSKPSEARQALSWYRGGDMKLVDDDIENWSVKKQDLNWRVVLSDRGNRRAILIFVFLFCFTVLAGTAVLSGYASKIFQNFHSAMESANDRANYSAAILACIKFISSLAAIQLIDRFGRKVLVLFSYVSMSLCLVVLTIYSFFQENDFNVKGWESTPIVVLSIYVATSTLGVGTVAEVIASEMFTPEIKGVAIGFVGIVGTLVVLATLQMYAVFVQFIGSYFNFLIEAMFAISGVFIAWKIVPETKGKTMVEIRNILSGNAPHINRRTEITKL